LAFQNSALIPTHPETNKPFGDWKGRGGTSKTVTMTSSALVPLVGGGLVGWLSSQSL